MVVVVVVVVVLVGRRCCLLVVVVIAMVWVMVLVGSRVDLMDGSGCRLGVSNLCPQVSGCRLGVSNPLYPQVSLLGSIDYTAK